MNFPEHAKADAVKDATQAVGQFLEWLTESPYELAKWDDTGERLVPAYVRIEALLAEWQGIDLEAHRAERERMYQQVARRNQRQ